MANEPVSSAQPVYRPQPAAVAGGDKPQTRSASVVTPSASERLSPVQTGQTQPPDKRPQIERIEPNMAAGTAFKEAMKEGRKEGGVLFGTVGGAFEGVSGALAAPYSSGRKPGLVGIPIALVSGLLSLVGKFFTGSGAILKATKGETLDRLKPADYASVREKHQEASANHDALQKQVISLKEQAAAKKEEVEAAAVLARSVSSDIKLTDMDGLKKVKHYEQLAKELESLAKELAEKQERLKDAEKLLKKRKGKLDKANTNIPQEAAHSVSRAEKASRTAAELIGSVD